MTTKPPELPYSLESERALVGACLIDPDAVLYLPDLQPADFFNRTLGRAFETIRAMSADGVDVDVISVAAQAAPASDKETEWQGLLIDLLAETPSSAHATTYAETIRDRAERRHMIRVSQAVAKAAYDLKVPAAETHAAAEAMILDARPVSKTDVAPISTAVLDFGLELASRKTSQTAPGLSSGFVDLDKKLGGLQAGQKTIVAARPGMGKTAMITGTVIANAIERGKRVLWFSLEMTSEQVIGRLVANLARVSMEDLRRPWELDGSQNGRISGALKEINAAPLLLDVSESLTVGDVRARATVAAARHGTIDLIVVDHFGLMVPDGYSRDRHDIVLGNMSRHLTATAKQTGAALLLAVQLSRGVEQRGDKRPMLSDLRDSGRLEENAYQVIGLFRESAYDTSAPANLAEALVLKNRDGRLGPTTLHWQPEFAAFRNAQVQEISL